ncbi:adenylyl-sulfate kinase [Pseudomonas sp. HMWF032]|uniref:adenylyl-sulfate kinase n=1 Tax=unclassified Pseudomonas TaxID=196821 RepID=UPI000D375EB0|nr:MULTISPECIES: adenylyl-sulfate kinase [unclassified Pseudomonas]PTS85769.1 adenylyl-sulfate kinase [Pseudomonas sp. HMWF032]PTT86085.1 adenylyl-sulfate kinase [Pseudomonas sp. HMWF010]WAC45231.1 adenylyl-sulfate kinase [Pseudomonas sp. SL4(2022)]
MSLSAEPNLRLIERVSRKQRELLNAQRGQVLWLTGLSGAGKSTLAYALEAQLYQRGRRSVVLDGDHLRGGLCADLAFTPQARHENLRRAAEVAKLFVDSGVICVAAFISPSERDRDMVRRIVGPDDFMEVYLDCSLQVCEARDVKGLYLRARAGEIADFTGITSTYEPPLQPDLTLRTAEQSIEECVAQLINCLA